MVDGAAPSAKQQPAANNKSFNDQNSTKIVLRRLPPTLTSEQFLEIVAPLPDHDYYRFCKADFSLGQQYAFTRAYLNIPNRQDLIIFTEKFQGYVFLDKNGNEYIGSVEYAPSQTRPKIEEQTRKDPKVNSIEQDPEYQAFAANINAPISAADALPNAETMLEEIEKKQREIQEAKHKVGATTTPLLEYLKRKREERKQDKIMRIQQGAQRRGNKQSSRMNASALNEDPRAAGSGRQAMNDEDYGSSARYAGGDRSNRHPQQRYEKGDYRATNHEQKRPNHPSDHPNPKPPRNRDHQNSKGRQQQQQGPSRASKEYKTSTHAKAHGDDFSSLSQVENPRKQESKSAGKGAYEQEKSFGNDRAAPSNKDTSVDAQKLENSGGVIKNRPSIQIYNPGERARLRRQQNPPS